LELLLGVRFIASEASTGDRQRGRIDTLGLDENNSPVIIEYKKTADENIINQGLFYLDWLVDHRGDFTLRAQEALGKNITIDWSYPRVILVAERFSDYDKSAVKQIAKNIELWEYQKFGEDKLFIHCSYSGSKSLQISSLSKPNKHNGILDESLIEYSVDQHLTDKPSEIVGLFHEIKGLILSLASENEITVKATKLYIAFRHGKNFCEMWIQKSQIRMWLDIPYESIDDPHNMVRNMKGVGHWGTGDVEIVITPSSDLKEILALISQSFALTR
jgi:predicted transport protein